MAIQKHRTHENRDLGDKDKDFIDEDALSQNTKRRKGGLIVFFLHKSLYNYSISTDRRQKLHYAVFPTRDNE